MLLREVVGREAGVREVGVEEVGAREVGVREVGAREVGVAEIETVSSGEMLAVCSGLVRKKVQDRLHIGANFVCGARLLRLLRLLRRGLPVFACAWVRALTDLVWWMPDEGGQEKT